MSLRSFNNISYSSNNLLRTKTNIESIVGRNSPTFTGMWDGGFAGISDSGVIEIKNAINRYILQTDDIISGFSYNLIEMGFKGEVQDCAIDFINSVKSILQSYVNMMRQNISDLDFAYQKYIDATDSLAKMIFSDSSDIVNETKKLRSNVNLSSIN